MHKTFLRGGLGAHCFNLTSVVDCAVKIKYLSVGWVRGGITFFLQMCVNCHGQWIVCVCVCRDRLPDSPVCSQRSVSGWERSAACAQHAPAQWSAPPPPCCCRCCPSHRHPVLHALQHVWLRIVSALFSLACPLGLVTGSIRSISGQPCLTQDRKCTFLSCLSSWAGDRVYQKHFWTAEDWFGVWVNPILLGWLACCVWFQ